MAEQHHLDPTLVEQVTELRGERDALWLALRAEPDPDRSMVLLGRLSAVRRDLEALLGGRLPGRPEPIGPVDDPPTVRTIRVASPGRAEAAARRPRPLSASARSTTTPAGATPSVANPATGTPTGTGLTGSLSGELSVASRARATPTAGVGGTSVGVATDTAVGTDPAPGNGMTGPDLADDQAVPVTVGAPGDDHTTGGADHATDGPIPVANGSPRPHRLLAWADDPESAPTDRSRSGGDGDLHTILPPPPDRHDGQASGPPSWFGIGDGSNGTTPSSRTGPSGPNSSGSGSSGPGPAGSTVGGLLTGDQDTPVERDQEAASVVAPPEPDTGSGGGGTTTWSPPAREGGEEPAEPAPTSEVLAVAGDPSPDWRGPGWVAVAALGLVALLLVGVFVLLPRGDESPPESSTVPSSVAPSG
ncbi:MAG: hypothetical protein ACK5RL_19575 [Acidimicrobiales bacterium]